MTTTLNKYQQYAEDVIADLKADYGDDIGHEHVSEMVKNIIASEGWSRSEQRLFLRALTLLGY